MKKGDLLVKEFHFHLKGSFIDNTLQLLADCLPCIIPLLQYKPAGSDLKLLAYLKIYFSKKAEIQILVYSLTTIKLRNKKRSLWLNLRIIGSECNRHSPVIVSLNITHLISSSLVYFFLIGYRCIKEPIWKNEDKHIIYNGSIFSVYSASSVTS